MDPSLDRFTWEALMIAARERFKRLFGHPPESDDCLCCGDGADDFDADELGLDPEDDDA